MPYKSDSQRRLFHAKEARGEIPHETVAEFDKASKGKELPEKLYNGGSVKGATCPSCGYAFGGKVDGFADALRGRQ